MQVDRSKTWQNVLGRVYKQLASEQGLRSTYLWARVWSEALLGSIVLGNAARRVRNAIFVY